MDFQSIDSGSIPLPRSRCRRIGRYSPCAICGEQFASFRNKGFWSRTCGPKCKVLLTQRTLAENQARKPSKPPRKVREVRVRGLCATCGATLPGVNKHCFTCHVSNIDLKVRVRMDSLTLQDVIDSSRGYKSVHMYQKVRHNALWVMKQAKQEKVCNICKYDKGVQVCHIKGIGTFPKTTKLSEINSLSNLIYLCPNHHWELDHGMLTL